MWKVQREQKQKRVRGEVAKYKFGLPLPGERGARSLKQTTAAEETVVCRFARGCCFLPLFFFLCNQMPQRGLTLLHGRRLHARGLQLEGLFGRHVAAGAFVRVLVTVGLVAVSMTTVSEAGSLRVFKSGTATEIQRKHKARERIWRRCSFYFICSGSSKTESNVDAPQRESPVCHALWKIL